MKLSKITLGLLIIATSLRAHDVPENLETTTVDTLEIINAQDEALTLDNQTRSCCKTKEFCRICVNTLSVNNLLVSNGETIINGTLIINGTPFTGSTGTSAISQYAFLVNDTVASIGPTVSIPFSNVINTSGISSSGTAINIANTGIYKVTWTIPSVTGLVELGLTLNGTTVPGGIFDTNQAGELVGQAYVAVTSPNSILNLTNPGGPAFLMTSLGGTPFTTMTIEKLA